MTPEQVTHAVKKYAAALDVRGVAPARHTSDGVLPTGAAALSHARWMCDEVVLLLQEGHTEKAMRWLGFIQGILWMTGQASISMMKDDNR